MMLWGSFLKGLKLSQLNKIMKTCFGAFGLTLWFGFSFLMFDLFSDCKAEAAACSCSCTLCSNSFASLEEFSQHKCCQVKTEDALDSSVDVKTEEESNSAADVKTEPNAAQVVCGDSRQELGEDVKSEPSEEDIPAYSLQEVEAILKSEDVKKEESEHNSTAGW
jgi:hypothetical protein